jgi:hypothetical protein
MKFDLVDGWDNFGDLEEALEIFDGDVRDT